jgi:hypothetical protein
MTRTKASLASKGCKAMHSHSDSEWKIKNRYDEMKLRFPNALDEAIIRKIAHNVAFDRSHGRY